MDLGGIGRHPNHPTEWRADLLGTWDWERRCYIHDHGWAGGPAHATRNRARGMAHEHSGWQATIMWAWRWSADIQRMLEECAAWVLGSEPKATDSVAPGMPR